MSIFLLYPKQEASINAIGRFASVKSRNSLPQWSYSRAKTFWPAILKYCTSFKNVVACSRHNDTFIKLSAHDVQGIVLGPGEYGGKQDRYNTCLIKVAF